MKLPLQITFRNMEGSPAMEENIKNKVEKLERCFDQIIACRIVVEAMTRRRQQGNVYHVRIDVTVPGGEIAVSRDPAVSHAHEDVYVAIRDAFDAARRQLEERSQRRQRRVKHHESAPQGRVAELFPEQHYGTIETLEGRRIYFHKNSLINLSFAELSVGAYVSFSESTGDEGPQASSVKVLA
ncbi:MAG TPA: ribosome-associated translation inhibitor RaiA [Gammaproteobacteria bacterium]|nr:ribosome-associated translation inhibitor RaiA [Gammaproteobacteria bacterium]